MNGLETEMACIPVYQDGLKKLALDTMQKMEEARDRVLTIMKYSGYWHLDMSVLPVVNLNSSKVYSYRLYLN